MGLEFKRRFQHTSKIVKSRVVVLSIQRDASTKVTNSTQILVNFLLKVTYLYYYYYYYYYYYIITSVPRVLSFMKSHRSEAYSQ